MTLVGTRARHVRILRRPGGGGMGEVYEGLDEKLQRRVAIKVLRGERPLDPEAKREFLREARILDEDHPVTLRSRHSLARLLRAEGREAEAAALTGPGRG